MSTAQHAASQPNVGRASRQSSGLSLSYRPVNSSAEIAAALDAQRDVLGAAWHAEVTDSDVTTTFAAGQTPCPVVTMPVLSDTSGFLEIWHAPGPFRDGEFEGVRFRCNDELLFAAIVLDEQDDNILALARRVYTSLFALLDTEDFTHLVRCWNYLPRINVDELADSTTSIATMERYKLFNIGRQDAFGAAGYASTASAPAACALGTQTGGMVLYCIAARRAPQNIENPRQVSAYSYPEQYGPRRPFFSRASLLELAAGQHALFVSGTASIVGHESQHQGDVVAQTEESLRNVTVLIEQANQSMDEQSFSPHDLQYKVFIRHRDDFRLVSEVLHKQLGTSTELIYLAADVCRAELLVEIEATGFSKAKA
jgi:chorismate lyase/3-hydroxybenzoate synthase